jgi:hypothetical protein
MECQNAGIIDWFVFAESSTLRRAQHEYNRLTFVPALIVQPAAAQTPPIPQVIGPSVQTVQPLAPLAQFCQRSLIPQTVGQTSGTTLANFQALQSKDGPFSGFLSADTSGAAGLFAFGETINVAIAFF